MRNLGKVASPFLLILALALSSSCGLNPPENLKLGGPSALPDGDACPDGAELREEKDTNIELPAGGGLKVALGYAVMCGRSSDERFLKDGLFMGWGQDGELAVKGQFSRGTPSGSWELLFPSGQTLAAFNLAGGKVSALGEYFDEEGEPTPAPSLIDADTIGGSGAYTTFLERFENTPQAGLARQRLATARFKESGHFITKRINISGWGGMAS